MASFLLMLVLCALLCTSCLVNGAIIRQEGQDEPGSHDSGQPSQPNKGQRDLREKDPANKKGLDGKSGACITRTEYRRLMSLLEELRRHLNLDYLAAYAPEDYPSRIPHKRMDASEFLG